MGRVIHFEITADDTARAQKFYEIFGWEIKDAGMDGMEYLLAQTGEGEGIDGAIMSRNYRPQPVINWISVDDLDDMIEKVKTAGGKIIGDRHTIPGVGDTIYASDTEGNTFGMLQPAPREKAN
jgi:predicted enzyme related to lactoylglutathione lyase